MNMFEVTQKDVERRNIIKGVVDGLKSDEELEGYEFSNITHGELTPKTVVDTYRDTGKYYDIDYPGGIEQFIADYEAGKFDE